MLEVGDASVVAEKAATECAAQGWSPIEIAAAVSSDMATNPQFQGMLASQQDIPYFVHDAATKTFWSALDTYAPTLHTSPNFGEQAIIGWAEGALLQDAIKSAAPSSGTAVTPAVVKKGLYNLPSGDNLGGSAPGDPLHQGRILQPQLLVLHLGEEPAVRLGRRQEAPLRISRQAGGERGQRLTEPEEGVRTGGGTVELSAPGAASHSSHRRSVFVS